MPELPDVEVFRRYFERHAGGADVVDAEVLDERCLEGVGADRFERELSGSSFGRTSRRGKHLFVALANGRWLTLHFGMTGYLAVSEAGEAAEYARILFHLGGGRILSYVLKRMLGRAGTTASPETFAREHELGPDALEMGSDEFTELLTTVRGGAKSLLMNQSRLAGIGNIYSDEMLFHAGIHPSSACRELDREARDRLDVARAEVLKTAIDCDVDPDAMPPDWLLPRREDGTSCPRCGGTIRRTVISGRGAYVCPDHQRRYG